LVLLLTTGRAKVDWLHNTRWGLLQRRWQGLGSSECGTEAPMARDHYRGQLGLGALSTAALVCCRAYQLSVYQAATNTLLLAA
jgi:hypothetical protein